ncbi:MAG: peptidase family C69 [Parvularculaceae bacterium]
MCDTFALRRDGVVWFAKNSDREPDEPQLVEHHPAVRGDGAGTLRCTYVDIEQVPFRRAVVLSRPEWMWGAEMGVNDAGVAIGNEAVFSRSVMKKGAALLGMDLVRLGLERASSAHEAVDIMIDLLARYGQGGPAGHRDKGFRYDNSFLVADADVIFVLETAGRDWAVKRAEDGWSISNTYTLGKDHDRASAPGVDFKAAHEAFLMPRLACASARRASTFEFAASADAPVSFARLADQLRAHASGDGFSKGSNRDVCMHASGPLRPHASTASMIVRLTPGAAPAVAFTGTPQPCVSLFKPAFFGCSFDTSFSPTLFEQGTQALHRAKADETFRLSIRASIAEAEMAIFSAMDAGAPDDAERIAKEWIKTWLPAKIRSSVP